MTSIGAETCLDRTDASLLFLDLPQGEGHSVLGSAEPGSVNDVMFSSRDMEAME